MVVYVNKLAQILGDKKMQMRVVAVFCLIITLTPGCGKYHKSLSQLSDEDLYALARAELEDEGRDVGHYERALSYIREARALRELPSYIALSAHLLTRLGRVELALREVELFFSGKQKDESLRLEMLNTYACLLAMQEKFEEACALWQELANNPSYATPECAFYNAGMLSMKTKNIDRARTYFDDALSYNPSFIAARLARAQLCVGPDTCQARSEVDAVLFLDPHNRAARKLYAQMNRR